ncbi:MAG: LTA synthase family protein [Anaerovoracaceae bacterium]|jgi:phosphoglycerol transferase MdoB-like AlkP superfamily enzyme
MHSKRPRPAAADRTPHAKHPEAAAAAGSTFAKRRHRFFRDVRREFNIRKLILCLILLSGLVFLILQWGSFLSPTTFMNGEHVKNISVDEDDPLLNDPQQLRSLRDDTHKYQLDRPTTRSVDMKGSHTVTQTFTARYSLIKRVRLFFNNPDNYTATGTVTVSILDRHDKVVCKDTVDASLIANDSATIIDFIENSSTLNSDKIISKKFTSRRRSGIRLRRDRRYKICVTTKNVSSAADFRLYLGDETYHDDEVCARDGRTLSGQRLFAGLRYLRFNLPVAIQLLAILLLAGIFVLLPWQKLQRLLSRHHPQIDLNRLISRILFAASPLLGFLIIEKAAGSTLRGCFAQLFCLDGLLNIMIIGFIWWLLYSCINRTKYTVVTLISLCFGFGLANYILLLFRDSPLAAADFASLGTAMDVAGNYSMYWTQTALWAFAYSMAILVIALSLRSYPGLPIRRRLAAICLAAVWAGGFYLLIFGTDFLKKNDIYVSGFRPKWSYQSHGYTLAFFITLRGSHVSKPDAYTPQTVEDIAAAYSSDRADAQVTVSKKTPNIIVIMNEAYSDPRVIADFSTNREFMPCYKSLKKNTIKGTLHTSIFGGSTANTEFEFLTGNSMAYLPYHVVAYNNNIKTKLPSLATTLTAEGYGGITAFHPGMNNSYNRSKVYPRLGFRNYISLEDMKNPDLLRAYVSDKCDYETVMQEYRRYRRKNQKKPWFLFNVTIQNHSDYKLTSGYVGSAIHISDAELEQEEATQYLNMIKKSDDALKELIRYFKKVDEPTIVVLFGDHQARLEDEFYEELMRRAEKNTNLSELEVSELQYQVPFMIWANYGIDSRKDVTLSANYLQSYLLQTLNLPMTGYDKFLMDLYRKVPSTTAIAYRGRDGRLYEAGSKSKYTPDLHRYQILQYNDMVDTGQRVDGFFELKKAR